MADFSFRLPDAQLQSQVERAVDQEGKIPRSLQALGPVAGRGVVLLDADRGVRAGQLEELGAQVSSVPDLSTSGLPQGRADAVVSCWAGFRGESPDADTELREAELILRPGGRLLVVHDYGRDDVSLLLDDEAREHEQMSWSRRDGWFVEHDFKVRVLHCWWTFDSLEQARDLLAQAFGAPGAAVSQGLRRPRLAYKVAVYHRTLGVPS